MKIKCLNCEHIYMMQMGQCEKCQTRGGFLQEPKMKTIAGKSYHLEETLVHKKSNNEYQIKEIQKNGLIAKITKSPIAEVTNKPAYISNSDLGQYVVKK